MPQNVEATITTGNVNNFEPSSLLSNPDALDSTIGSSLKKYFASTVNMQPGDVSTDTARELVSGIAHYEVDRPLYSVKPFRYLPVPILPELGVEGTAESSVRSAIDNMTYMQERFGNEVFAAELPRPRSVRAFEWGAQLDNDYEMRVRGGSGAGTFSIDYGLGVIDRRDGAAKYKELWRAGIDTVHANEQLGARFTRTGSGIKEGKDSFKGEAFGAFYRRYKLMPQQLLGFVGLYHMRELEPDFALALTTEGAMRLSTLNDSRGECDYDGIFEKIGFQESTDPNWQMIPDFQRGFYKAISDNVERRRQHDTLHLTQEALKSMQLVDSHKPDIGRLYEPCSDDSKETLKLEIRAARHEI